MKTRKTFYIRRSKNLKKIGFGNYKDYLASPLWFSIRSRIVKKRRVCKKCGEPATQVHHLRYSVNILLGKCDSGLMALCGHCHQQISLMAIYENVHDSIATTKFVTKFPTDVEK